MNRVSITKIISNPDAHKHGLSFLEVRGAEKKGVLQERKQYMQSEFR